ncbi:MAG: hypothetical protein IT162_14630 [Bryobacterales bacterium]|nr:hypothetical protein [Bryobacterales bacterium]
MRATSASLLLALAAAAAAQQSGGTKLGSGNFTDGNVHVSWETRLEPGSPPILKHGSGTLTENRVAKRHVVNFDSRTYFGYDLRAEALADGRVRLHFAPLSLSPEKMGEIFKQVTTWTPLPRPAAPGVVELHGGETVALDLFVNPSTGQKVTDYITVAPGKLPPETITGVARDFTIDDVSIELATPEVRANGAAIAESRGTVIGPVVWLDLPGHGRFAFALAPRPDLGAQRLGEIRGSRMSWRHAGNEYVVTVSTRIVPGRRAYNLYVLPVNRNVKEFVMMAGPKLDDAVHSRP